MPTNNKQVSKAALATAKRLAKPQTRPTRNEELDDDDADDARYPWHIKADGDQAFPQPANGKDFSLEEIRGFVGGSFEMVYVPKAVDPRYKLVMLVDDGGKLVRLPLNDIASMLVRMPIVGDVLVCPTRMVK